MLGNARAYVCLALVFAGALLLLPVASAIANPDPPAWSSFLDASFKDIYLTKPLASDRLDYTLSLGAHPKVILDGVAYDVNWIQSYFVVGKTEQTTFTATDAGIVTDWKWEAKPNPGQIAGWVTTGSSRINPGQSKKLGFGSLNITGSNVLSGFHLGYQSGTKEVTGWYRGNLTQVPEPSSIAALICGVCGFVWRRKK